MSRENKRTDDRVRSHKILFGIGIIGVVMINIAAWKSTAFSDWYIRHVFPIWLNTYARLTSKVPVSVGEIMLILAVLATLFGICFFIFDKICCKRFQKAVRRFGTVYAWTVLAVSYVMTLNCFILYHGSSFSEKYMVYSTQGDRMVASVSGDAAAQVPASAQLRTSHDGYTKQELAILRDHIVVQCNRLAQEIGRDESGAAYYEGDLIKASMQAMQALGGEYDQLAGFYVTPKYLSCSGFFSQQYIMGYYFPFSMEANINSVMYVTNVAPTVCHELAHTKGFIYEDDANLIGFLACIRSDDPFLQYCGYLSVLDYVNNDFYGSIDKNGSIYRSHVRISNTVADDNIFLTRENWEEVEKKAVVKTATVKQVSNTLMDTTLKLNGVEEGVLQYDDVVGLLLAYYDGELY